MIKKVAAAAFLIALLAGCATKEQACEDVTLVVEQTKQCQSLNKQMKEHEKHTLIWTELQRRYQQDCIDGRYYRNDKQDAICENKNNIEKVEDKKILK
jgi:hypothetical protein